MGGQLMQLRPELIMEDIMTNELLGSEAQFISTFGFRELVDECAGRVTFRTWLCFWDAMPTSFKHPSQMVVNVWNKQDCSS